MRVVFMGTPDISAVCLEKLLAQHFSVVGVYTKPDAPQNRGMRLAQSPVKKVALAAGLPVFQPERLRDPETVQTLRDLHPDVIAVVAYGKILPPEVLEIPPGAASTFTPAFCRPCGVPVRCSGPFYRG